MLDIKDIDLSMAPEGAQYFLLEPQNVRFHLSQYFRDVEGREGVEVLFYKKYSKTWEQLIHPWNFMSNDARIYSIEDIRNLQTATQGEQVQIFGKKRSDYW